MAKELKRRIVAEFSAKNRAKGEMAGFRRDMDTTGRAMKRMATSALAAAGLGGGIYALKRTFDYVTKAAMIQEDALFLLSAALKTAGEYSYGTMNRFQAFAASIQEATVYGDEEVLSLMQLMKSLGVTANKLELATRMAIGLAAATGRDVRSMSMYIALAQQGEFTMLRRYIPALRSTTDATEQLRIITEFAAAGFEIAKAKAETTSGALQQMKNAYGDVAEIIGASFLPSMKEMTKRQKTFLEENKGFLKDYLTLVAEGIEMLDWASRKFIGAQPSVMIYKWMTKPEKIPTKRPLAGPRGIPEIVSFEEPPWIQDLMSLNKMTEAQKKAAASMYEMSMKARGLSEELAREKKITQFAALAKVRYGVDVDGARAAEERFIKALEDSEAATKAAAEQEKMRADALAVERKKMELEMERWDDVARTMEDSFSGALERLGKDWRNFGDIGKQVLQEILLEMMRVMIWRPAAQAMAGWLQPAMAGIFGGIGGVFGVAPAGIPTTATRPSTVGPTLVPSGQHGGHIIKTGLAIIHKDETLSGVGKGGGPWKVEIHNEGSEKLEVSEAEIYTLSDERILHVTMRAMIADGPYRKCIKNVRS